MSHTAAVIPGKRILTINAGAVDISLPWLDADVYLTYLRTAQLPATALHHSSMLHDNARGRRMEIDFTNGAMSEKGKRQGIPTPYTCCIADLIRFREQISPGNKTP